jgi:two-component system, response regulator YesN
MRVALTSTMDATVRIDRVVDFIRMRHIDPAIDLRGAADAVDLSTFHLSRLFKRTTGIGFANHLRSVRVTHASELLQSTALSVKEVAALVGYTNTNALDRNFKAVLGVTPTMYRQMIGDGHPQDIERNNNIPRQVSLATE